MERGRTGSLNRRKWIIIILLIVAAASVPAAIYFFNETEDEGGKEADVTGPERVIADDPARPAELEEPASPDDAPGSAVAAVQNANGNASNMGFVLEAGEYTYYADFVNSGLTMETKEGAEKKTLDPDPCYYLGMASGHLYYYSPKDTASEYGAVIRMDPEKTSKEAFTKAPGLLSSLCVGEKALYLSVSAPAEAAGLYRVPLGDEDGSVPVAERVADGAVSMVNAEGGRIFFRKELEASGAAIVMSVSEDGADARVVCGGPGEDRINFYAVSGGYVYFSDSGRKLYRADLTGTGERELIEADADVSAFNLSGDKLYVVTIHPSEDEQDDWRERVTEYSEGGKKAKVVADGLIAGTPIGISGEDMYCFKPGKDGGKTSLLTKIAIDGAGKEAS
jgi:dipeptidyl aminopeptidase/acylaminoacyl peptidase